ncbi:MAG: YbaB/EbfC family nucleoid-associated protein [Candidatus Saccharicenans sp.]|nr:MAG: YbaB/EbfC family nucleoid-associated protein [Candidatus Aminicenantes bacterium]HEK85636.1 YbaB/EbfC family nucleoid-associated protein [Candidatus Aminicenantes bacterium]
MKNLAELQKMMKAAKEFQDKLQKELAEMRIEGSSGGGMVTVVLDGQKNCLEVRLDPEVVNKDDIEMLQDLIVSAFREAVSKVEAEISSKMSSFTGGLKIPGLF